MDEQDQVEEFKARQGLENIQKLFAEEIAQKREEYEEKKQ